MPRSEDRWYFAKDQLNNTPSVRCGYSADRELSCRQQAANFIQDMGQRLQVTQLCINTAIVYMHRFYMFHSFTQFHRTAISAAALFLAAKVEEQPRKLEHVIKVAYMCLHREQSQHLDTKSEQYLELAQDLVVNENVLLQTLGFDVAIDHPHTHVVQCCRLVKASKDLAQTSYFMASNSLHLTTMCLQYRPTLVACFCIHLAMKWSNWQIPESSEGRPWFFYVDSTVTQDALEQLTAEFLAIFEKCPSRLKRKIMAMSTSQNPALLASCGIEDKKHKDPPSSSSSSSVQPSTSSVPQRSAHHGVAVDEASKHKLDPMTMAPRTQHNYKKLIPQSHGHHSTHGSHSNREQSKTHSHGHAPGQVAGGPPKKGTNRPPENMYPPPIRIPERSRTSFDKPDHYKMSVPQPHTAGGMMQPPSSSNFIINAHHPSVPSHSSQKSKYEVPPPSNASLPSQPPPLPTVQPPPLPPLPSTSSNRHLDVNATSNTSYGNAAMKQEKTEQSQQRFDSHNTTNAPLGIKQDSHNLFSTKSENMSHPTLSNRLTVEQNNNSNNRYSISDNTLTSNNSVSNSSSNSNLFNVNVKQEPSSSIEQNHHQQPHGHHRNHDSSNVTNCNGGGVSGGRKVKQELNEYQHNVNSNSNFVKRSPSFEHTNHYQQDHHRVNNSDPTKKEPVQTGSNVNNAFDHSSARAASTNLSSKHQSQYQQHSSKNDAVTSMKPVKAPSIFSPEKDPPPPVGVQIQQPVNTNQVNKLKRKRLSSSGSETEVMVPLIKKLQQDEIARYEDPARTSKGGGTSFDKTTGNSHSSSGDGDWNVGGDGSVAIEHDSVSKGVGVSTNHSIESVEVGATIEIVDHLNDKKHKEGRERKKKKKHKEHKEHKDRERHRHKEKHKSKDKHRDSLGTNRNLGANDTGSIHYSVESMSSNAMNSSPAANYSSSIESSGLKIKIPREKLAKVMPALKVKFSKDVLQGMGKNQGDSNAQNASSSHHRAAVRVSSTNRHQDSMR